MSEPLSLSSLPLFPLNSVLFPGGLLPLQIFEVRYLDLMRKCIKTSAPFGVVSLLKGAEVRKADPSRPTGDGFAQELFADVGTLATVIEVATPQPGLMVVRCTGGGRFRIQQRRQLKHGLWVADVVAMPADTATAVPDDLQPVVHALQRVIDNLQERAVPQDHMPLQPPYQLEDCAWVANRWCELLSLPTHLKQGLMQLDSPLLRLELVGDFLRKGGIIA
jgi:Lon protease-like protein